MSTPTDEPFGGTLDERLAWLRSKAIEKEEGALVFPAGGGTKVGNTTLVLVLGRIEQLEADLKSATASYREALDHLRYITTNREWGKSIRYQELDEFLSRETLVLNERNSDVPLRP